MIADHDGGASFLAPAASAFILNVAERCIPSQRDQVSGIKPNGIPAPFT
jgi:hypothetical protein